MYKRGSRTRRREKEIKNVFEKNYDWKLSKLKQGNKYPDIGCPKGLQQNEPKQTHTKIYHN